MTNCFFDTETTDVPYRNWNTSFIIQLGYVIENNGNILDSNVFFVANQPPSKKAAQDIHKISYIDLQTKGRPIKTVLLDFIKALDKYEVSNIITHSIPFDIGFILNECQRCGIDNNYWNKFNYYDTKKSCHYTPGEGGLAACVKAPEGLMGRPHDALYDSYLCMELFRKTQNKETMRAEKPPIPILFERHKTTKKQ